MSLRAILGGSRVKKKRAPTVAASKKSSQHSAASRAKTPWPTDLRQTKPGSRSVAKRLEKKEEEEEEEDAGAGDFFSDDDLDQQLDDSGLVASLANDLSLRDVVQALRYARGNMFDPLPGSGFVGNSTRVAELLNMRRRLPALATTAHVAALLPNATATERETVALIRAGVLRRVIQPQWRRGGAATFGGGGGGGDREVKKGLAVGGESLSEILIETVTLEELVHEGPTSGGLGNDTKAAFVAWLQGKETNGEGHAAKIITINGHAAPQLDGRMADELVRAGFLLGHGAARGLGTVNIVGHRSAAASVRGARREGGSAAGSHSDTGDVFARPEDRTTLLSLETVAKAASGSFDAVGGIGAVYTAGGGGGTRPAHKRLGAVAAPTEDLLLAVPGHGTFIKLVSAALAHLMGLLARTPYREALESTLKERWDAAGGSSSNNSNNIRSSGHGGYRRVSPSRTRKWKDLYGLSFGWVLAEAIGAGLVEVFETGSVGRGVRLI